jgi:hypothetical protein
MIVSQPRIRCETDQATVPLTSANDAQRLRFNLALELGQAKARWPHQVRSKKRPSASLCLLSRDSTLGTYNLIYIHDDSDSR